MADSSAAVALTTERWTAWDRFVAGRTSAGFMQTSWWADFRLTSGYGHFGAILKDGDEILGGAVVMTLAYAPGRSFYYIPEGPVLPRDPSLAAPVFAAVLRAVDEHRAADGQAVSHLRIEPRWHVRPDFLTGFQPLAVPDGYTEPRNTLCIDLRPPESAILAQMRPKGRYNIRVAARHGVTIVEDPSPRGLEDFQRIYEDMAERQGIGAKGPEYFQRLLSLLTRLDAGALFFAEFRGTRLAAALTVWFGGRATYFFGGSRALHREVMAPYLLHFEIMRRAKARGCDWYDLWGIAPDDDAEHAWRDITAFKRKFGGAVVDLVPTLDYVYDAAAYERYVAAQRDPGDR